MILMKSIIVVSLVALAHAKCDWSSEVGQWYPEAGQTFGVVIMDLGMTEQEIQALNPMINIDRIYRGNPYNVTYKPSRSGKWTEGCPFSLRIPDTSDPLRVDSSRAGHEEPATTSISGGAYSVGIGNDDDDDVGGGDEHYPQTTLTVRSTVTTRAITATVYGSDLPSASIEGGSQSADMSYTTSTKTGDSGNKPEGYPTLVPTSDMSTSASSNPSDLLSDEEAASCSDPKRHGQVDASNMSGTTHSTGAPKKTPTTSQDTETRSPISLGETAPSCTTASNAVTSNLQDASATATATTATGTEISETAPSSTLSQTDAPGDTQTKVPGATLSHEDHIRLPDGHSTQTHSDADGTEKVKTSTTKEATTTVTNVPQTEGFTGSTTIPEASVVTSPSDYSTKQIDTGTETASEETTTTFITSFSKSTTQTMTAVHPIRSDGMRPAFCLYDTNSYGPGELNEFRVLNSKSVL
ncbi:unnamed protein product [Fusarium graminearum]|uniref:LysM domain-containing protein n=1 Tax=Gibberella zeae TaxID=5518 RepID=A0A9N8RMM5_GIBZA|nr:unnamed protein product [Fusarium graminearum]